MKFCSTCDEIYNTTDQFCMHCGHKLKDDVPRQVENPGQSAGSPSPVKSCPSCNLIAHAGDTFCIHCGGPLSPREQLVARTPLVAASPPPRTKPARQPHKSVQQTAVDHTLTRSILEQEKNVGQLTQQLAEAIHRLERVEAGESALKDAVKHAAEEKEKNIRTLQERQAELSRLLSGKHAGEQQAIDEVKGQLSAAERRLEELEQKEKALREEEGKLGGLRAEVQELDKLLAAVALKTQADVHSLAGQLAAGKEQGEREAQSLAAVQQKVAAIDAALAAMEQTVSATGEAPVIDERLPEKVASLASTIHQVEKNLTAAVLRESGQVAQLHGHVSALLGDVEALKAVPHDVSDDVDKKLSLVSRQLEKLEEQGGAVSKAMNTLPEETMKTIQEQVKEQDKRLLRMESQRLTPQEASPADLERELEIGRLRKELDCHVDRLSSVEASLEAQKETAQLFGSFEGSGRVEERLKAVLEQPDSVARLEQQLNSMLASAGRAFEEGLASQAIEVKKLRDNTAALASSLRSDISDLRALSETSAASTIEKQTVENTRTIDRIQKGIGKLYSEVGSLVADRSKWAAVVEQEIREKVKAVLGEQKESIQRVYDDISSEFSKLNILINHHEKRMDFFMHKTEEELKELREHPADLSRLTSTVITELDEIKFRMQQLEHKAVHADTEEIVDAIAELEHKLSSLSALQPIIIE